MIKEKLFLFIDKFDFSIIPEQIQDVINDAYNRFVGDGYFHYLYIIGLIFLFFMYKKDKTSEINSQEILKRKRLLLGLYTIIIFSLSFSRIYAWFYVEATGGDYSTYWRTFWMLPIPIGISYFFTDIVSNIREKSKKNIALLLSIIIVCISGNFLPFNNVAFKTNNLYKLPDDLVDIVLYISNLDWDYKKLVGPEEFCVYTRLIDGNIILSETRHDLGGVETENIIDLIEKHDYERMYKYCLKKDNNLLVLDRKSENVEDFFEYGNKLYENNTYILFYVDI